MLCTMEFLQDTFPVWEGQNVPSTPIQGVMTDSRQKVSNGLFIPIIGERFDAHQFIMQAIEQGAVAALWDKKHDIPAQTPEDFVFFLVEDTTVALQTLAQAYRQKVNPHVIGITGSNGKTTTKDLMQAVLNEQFITHATIGNFNNEIGLPLTILQMDPTTEMLVLEMGMNGFHEIELLSKIAKPDDAIITNVGESHIEHLGSRAGIAQAKLEITNGLKQDGLLVIDGDEPLLTAYQGHSNTIRCGVHEENDYIISDVTLNQNGTTFSLQGQERFDIPLLGEHHAKNASFVIALAKKLGIDTTIIQKGLLQLQYSSMRFEKITGIHGVTLINDAYNASPTSMKAAIDVLKKIVGYNQKVLVLGDILELGNLSEEMHRSVAKVIEAPINVVYTYGEAAKVITEQVQRNCPDIQISHFTDREELITTLKKLTNKDTIILFKASRGMAFESFIHTLEE